MSLSVDGEGSFAYRVTIDGCPSSAVSRIEMVDDAATVLVPDRVDGLNMEGQKFSATVNPIAGKLTVSPLRIKIADIDAQWSVVFGKAPQNTTWLTAVIDEADTTIPVNSTAGFPSSGYIWIDFECIYYDSKDATNFLNCQRGSVLSDDLDSATWHYITDGERLRSPEVTDWPVLWEGRRVRVFRYEEGDDPLGDGTQCYLGVISSSPSFDGTAWGFGVDPITTLFEQMLGADLSTPCYPRGIYYSPSNPWRATFYKALDSNPYVSWGSAGIPCPVSLSGFFETQEAWCQALTIAIQAATAVYWPSTVQVIEAVSDGPSGWHLQYTTLAAGNARAVSIDNLNGSCIDHGMGGRGGDPQTIDGAELGSTPVSGATTYYFYPAGLRDVATGAAPGLGAYRANVIPGAGSVPRGSFHGSDPNDDERLLHVGGGSLISGLVGAINLSWPALSGPYQTSFTLDTFDTALREFVTAQTTESIHSPPQYFTSETMPAIRFGLSLTASEDGVSAYDFIQQIINSQARYSTLGVCPMIREADIDSANWYLNAVVGQPELVTKRFFTTFEPISIMDFLRPELQLAGCFPSINSLGQFVPKRLRLTVGSELSVTGTVDQDTLLTDEVFVSHEIGGLGQINQLLLRTGFDAQSQKWNGRTWLTRDVPAFGQSPAVRQIAIAPKSEYRGRPITDDDIVQLAGAYFGAFGGPYAIDTLDAAEHHDAELGDPLVFDSPHIPDETGELGVTGKVGLVISRSVEAFSARARFGLITNQQKIAGYAPGAKITFWTLIVGNQYTLLLGPTGGGMFPGSTSCLDWFAVGDRVKKVNFNTATGSAVAGTVIGVTVTTVDVAFDSATGTPDAFLMMANSDDAALAEDQRRFCSIANSDSVVEYDSEETPAYRFGA